MEKSEEHFAKEREIIANERSSYLFPNKGVNKFFDYLSAVFFFSGFGALLLIFFTEITLIDATCLFIISYVVQPSDGDRFEPIVKGIAEDLGNIRLNTSFLKLSERNK